MNRRIVFYLEDRGKEWIFHWITYMIAGLRHINKNTSRNRIGCLWGDNCSNQIIERNSELYKTEDATEPYNICFQNINNFLDFQSQTINLIDKKYNILFEKDLTNEDIIIYNYGEKIKDNPYHISKDGYSFLRVLLMDNLNTNNSIYKNKRYFLSRSKSHLLDGNTKDNRSKRRQILNEQELSTNLAKLDIETIFLEDIEIKNKIELFYNADMIISPNSGGLTFGIFASQNTKILEINTQNPHQIFHQYKSQCEALNIPYYKFLGKKIDDYDNMIVDINNFLSFFNNIA